MNIFNTKRSALFNFQTFFVILLAIIVPWAHWLAFEIFPTHARQKIDICIECVGYFHFAYKCAALSVYSVIGESAGLQSPKIYRNKHETCKAPLLSFLIRKKACSKCQIHLKKAIHQARIHFKLFFPYLLSRIDTQRHYITLNFIQ